MTAALNGAERMVAVSVRSLSKRFILSGGAGGFLKRGRTAAEREFWALKNVSFELQRGERLGVLGHNGAGKSTLLKILSRVLLPTSGEADLHGRVTSLLEVGTGFNPELTGRQNIFLNAALHGLTREEIDARLDAIIGFSEIGRFVDEPVKHYSTGMRSRLGFAVAAHLDPDILMLDEVLSVGDAAFQRKCLERMEDLTGGGRTLLFVSHATAAVRKFCSRCIWMDHGEIVMDGDAVSVCEAYEAQMSSVNASYRAKDVPASPGVKSGTLSTGVDSAIDEVQGARLVSAMVLNHEGEPARSVKIHKPCAIELVFDVLAPGRRIEPALHVKDDRGGVRFVAAFTSAEWAGGVNDVGRFRAVAEIPANILNEGLHFVTIALVTADPLVRHEQVERAVSFSAYETDGLQFGESARGNYARAFPGYVRPKLEWRLEKAD